MMNAEGRDGRGAEFLGFGADYESISTCIHFQTSSMRHNMFVVTCLLQEFM